MCLQALCFLIAEERAQLLAFEKTMMIDSGGYGTVYALRVEPGPVAALFPAYVGKVIAIKLYNADYHVRSKALEYLLRECAVAAAFDCGSVVSPLAVSIAGESSPLAIFPRYNQGSLFEVLHARRTQEQSRITTLFRETRVLVLVCRDLLDGLQHIHSKDFLHNDLTCQNILLHLEGESTVRVGIHDFGLATRMADQKMHQTFRTEEEEKQHARVYDHKAPELLKGACYTRGNRLICDWGDLQKNL